MAPEPPDAGGPPAEAADPLRPGDDRGDRLLQGDRELFPALRLPEPRREALLPAGLLPQRLPDLRGREPPVDPPAPRHVQRGSVPEEGARGLRLPPPLRLRQPAPEVRRVRAVHAARGLCFGHPRPLRDPVLGPGGRADRPAHGPPGTRGPDPAHRGADGGRHRRVREDHQAGRPCTGDDAHQAAGRGAGRVPLREGYQVAVPPLRDRDDRADRDHQGAQIRKIRRPGGD